MVRQNGARGTGTTRGERQMETNGQRATERRRREGGRDRGSEDGDRVTRSEGSVATAEVTDPHPPLCHIAPQGLQALGPGLESGPFLRARRVSPGRPTLPRAPGTVSDHLQAGPWPGCLSHYSTWHTVVPQSINPKSPVLLAFPALTSDKALHAPSLNNSCPLTSQGCCQDVLKGITQEGTLKKRIALMMSKSGELDSGSTSATNGPSAGLTRTHPKSEGLRNYLCNRLFLSFPPQSRK